LPRRTGVTLLSWLFLREINGRLDDMIFGNFRGGRGSNHN
jgi:hypothetical protein